MRKIVALLGAWGRGRVWQIVENGFEPDEKGVLSPPLKKGG
jgi:hypothetical protein